MTEPERPSSAAPTLAHFDIVFDGPPSHLSGRFVEVENELGESIKLGEWVQRTDGLWALRIRRAASPERVREQAIATGSPAACPECGAKFWTPGNLNIAIHADEEWRNGFAERMRHEGREQAIEECARVALSHAAQAGAAAHGAHNRRSDDEETIWCARESEAHGIANSIRALAAADGAGKT